MSLEELLILNQRGVGLAGQFQHSAEKEPRFRMTRIQLQGRAKTLLRSGVVLEHVLNPPQIKLRVKAVGIKRDSLREGVGSFAIRVTSRRQNNSHKGVGLDGPGDDTNG